MLENAGAHILVPRERDTQSNEVIIDNDSQHDSPYYREITDSPEQSWLTGDTPGFAIGTPPYTGNENPFKLGTWKKFQTNDSLNASIEWIPEIPESGDYFVSIAYTAADTHASDAHYTVFHVGGKTEFAVNQRIGGSTWIYLGQFHFKKGYFPDTQKVVLSTVSDDSAAWISADAVRFGGGMGNIARGGETSGRPRFTEAARYYMQFAGIPDTLVYNITEAFDDYTDDYRSRGEWVNYLRGAPFGPNKNREEKGLGIPVDLSLAFHTDAGITRTDTTIGTLAIYSSMGGDTTRLFQVGS